jgi:hypothetical protein
MRSRAALFLKSLVGVCLATAAWVALAQPVGASQSAPTTTSTAPGQATSADLALASEMLATPLPGLAGFTLVGPGATNGVLTPQTLGSYSNDPSEVEHRFEQYSSEPGFAGWIKSWQDDGGSDVVVEIGIRFHSPSEATTNSAAFVSTLSQGLAGGSKTPVESIPGATAFAIDEPTSTSGTTVVPAQQVQAVVFSDGDYFVALHADSLTGGDHQPIAPGTAIALALQQYEVLAPIVTPPHASKPQVHRASSGGSSALTFGAVLLGIVVLVLVGLAVFSSRRRKAALAFEPAVAAGRHRQAHPKSKSGTPEPPARNGAGPDVASDESRLVGANASRVATSRTEGLAASRSRHPSAAVALASNRPPQDTAGWYTDPSDSDHRRIRFWDGNGWTAHVAEPEG